ncbi:hypothetical protein JL722_15030 [Aureococcus anophagefferens]|nr:hypothetical protein JL722_15030 [Aureococcus anophagefferens]
MIEAIYSLNHVDNEPLSDHAKLLEAARAAGVQRAPELLARADGLGAREVLERYQHYVAMGINAVPVIVLDDKHVISNAPEKDLRRTFKHLRHGHRAPHPAPERERMTAAQVFDSARPEPAPLLRVRR